MSAIDKLDISESLLRHIAAIDLIFAEGFSLEDYLRDLQVCSLCLFFRSSEWYLIAPTVARFSNNPQVSGYVKTYLSDRAGRFEFPYTSLFGHVICKDYNNEQLAEGSLVLVLGNESDSSLKNKCLEQKVQLLEFKKFVFSANKYFVVNHALLEISQSMPDVQFLMCELPEHPRGELSSNEAMLMSTKQSFKDLLAKLKAGEKLENLNQAFAGKPYNNSRSVQAMLAAIPSTMVAGGLRFKDYQSELVNARDGRRVNPVPAIQPKQTLYLVGGCRAMGYGAPDDGTPAAQLQKVFNEHDIKIEVQNWAYLLSGRYRVTSQILKSLPLLPGDIIMLANIFDLDELQRFGIPHIYIDLRGLFNRPHNYGETIFDNGPHYTENGNRMLADAIYAKLGKDRLVASCETLKLRQEMIERSVAANTNSNYGFSVDTTQELPFGQPFRDYLNSLHNIRRRNGSIVMNCNPFTNGHRYLIEYASSKVDHLYVFVVEEDKSEFKFEDRIKLVSEGVKDLPNVSVHPSGQFIISALTFVDYFGKSELQDKVIDPSGDVELFARYIAPTLGINVRFAGEEPFDNVTMQYNQTMERILPNYGIDFEVIARKQSDEEPISASRVRKLIKTQSWDEIAKLVPVVTLKYLKQYFTEAIPDTTSTEASS
ncbi:MAG: adenylyltransferase/cytidyltransferase family protein [Coriobacteriales bacterium]|nr:adenylyltransferase/cytidyltransferase family protein [Coriobacteriales bacterium]